MGACVADDARRHPADPPGPGAVTSAEIVDRFFPGIEVGSDPTAVTHYAVKTKYSGLFGGPDGYICSREEAFRRLGQFIEGYRKGEIR